jgi:uncharacterized protein YdcH (DUF465 family)
MKIRQGFVSNSSSTSFVVCVPKSYNPTDKEIKKAYEEENSDYDDISVKQVRKALKGFMEDDFVGEEDIFLIDLLKDFILLEQGAGDERGSITNLKKENILKVKDKIDTILKEK